MKKILLSLFLVMVFCLSAIPALGFISLDTCNLEDYYVEDDVINFDGVLVDVKDIDTIDNEVTLKFLESGITYIKSIDQIASRDGISVKVLEIVTSGTEPLVHLCFKSEANCAHKSYYVEDQGFYFGGVLLEIKDIDLADNRIDLKFLDTGIMYDMAVGYAAEREGISVKLLAITDSTIEPSALLCMNEVEEEVFTPPFIIAVGDNAPASDVMTATLLSNELKEEGYDIPVGSVKLFSEVNAYVAEQKVVTAIYKDEAVIIVGSTVPAEYVVFAVEIQNILSGRGLSVDTILDTELESSDLMNLFVTEPEAKCTDSDGGKDYYKKGTVEWYVPDYEAFSKQTDTCRKTPDSGNTYSGDYLIEMTCEGQIGDNPLGTALSAVTYKCPYGCRDGACLSTPEVGKPDLQIVSIELERVTIGSVPAYRFVVYTKNYGSADAPKSNLHVEVSPKQPQAIDDGRRYGCLDKVNFPMPMNDIAPGPELRAGEKERATDYFNPSESGYITITATVDPYGVVAESNERNNVMSKRFYVKALVSEEHSCIEDEEPIEIAREEVKCLFVGSREQQKCYTPEPHKMSCKGTTSCEVDVVGRVGDKITWKSSCGGYAYTRIDGRDEYVKFDCSDDDEIEVPTCTDGIWNDGETGVDCGGPCPPCVETIITCKTGCLKDDTCLPFGTRMVEKEIPVFCNLEKRFKPQKEDGELCQNSYECLSNSCHNGQCISLEKELRETRGLLESIFEWLRNLFG